uniref:Uncharacterized protein n=1 Tax=Ditylenchus dipsaci TaxID=166011 RepID=A0A915EN20_9BILA
MEVTFHDYHNRQGRVTVNDDPSTIDLIEAIAHRLGSYASAEKFSRSPYMSSVNDLREELLKTKKAHSMALRDNSFMRTKLRIAEKECKRKEKEIGNLLSSDQANSSKYEEENEYLLSDRNVAKAAENRHMLGKMETECNRLKNHLSQSIPEGEFLREKLNIWR